MSSHSVRDHIVRSIPHTIQKTNYQMNENKLNERKIEGGREEGKKERGMEGVKKKEKKKKTIERKENMANKWISILSESRKTFPNMT